MQDMPVDLNVSPKVQGLSWSPNGQVFPQSGLFDGGFFPHLSTVGFPFLVLFCLSSPFSIVFPKDKELRELVGQ